MCVCVCVSSEPHSSSFFFFFFFFFSSAKALSARSLLLLVIETDDLAGGSIRWYLTLHCIEVGVSGLVGGRFISVEQKPKDGHSIGFLFQKDPLPHKMS